MRSSYFFDDCCSMADANRLKRHREKPASDAMYIFLLSRVKPIVNEARGHSRSISVCRIDSSHQRSRCPNSESGMVHSWRIEMHRGAVLLLIVIRRCPKLSGMVMTAETSAMPISMRSSLLVIALDYVALTKRRRWLSTSSPSSAAGPRYGAMPTPSTSGKTGK